MKALHTTVAVIGIALAGGAAWWAQRQGGGPQAVSVAAAASAAPGGRAQGAGSGAGGPVSVEVGRVEAARIADEAQAVGSVRARQVVMLRPEVSGRIAKIGFRDGQRVKRGQLLIQLDDTLQRAQWQQAQAQASIARTTLNRNRELVAQGFVSASVVDQSAAALEVAAAQVALADAQMARMRIAAPFDGVAGIRSVDVGDYVKDGADLVGIEDHALVWVDFRLAERYIARLQAGQPVEVQFDALPGRKFDARVEAIDSQLDANGRSLLVRARLPNPDGELRSGMFARTRTVFSVREQALLVPEEALVPQGGKQYLVKVIEGAGGKTSQRIEAKIGLRMPGKAEILEGLAAGDLVVTAGQARLLRPEPQPLRVVQVGGGDAAPPGGRAASGAAPAASAPARGAPA